METSILQRTVRSLAKVLQLAGAKSGILANGLSPALVSVCHRTPLGVNPGTTLLTPASALLLLARTDTGLDSFLMPCVTPQGPPKPLVAHPIIKQEPPCWACADHWAKGIPRYSSS